MTAAVLTVSPYLERPMYSEREATLMLAIRQSRREWRRLYSCFWTLRHENSRFIAGWRTQMVTDAWKSMRAEVRRYGDLRLQLRDLRG